MHVLRQNLRLGCLLIVLICGGVGNLYAELAIELLAPVHSSVYPACANILIQVNPTTDGEEIRDVYLYKGHNSIIRRLRGEPWEFKWEDVKPGFYPICAKVRGVDGGEAYSDTAYIVVGNVQKGDVIVNGGFDCDDSISPWRTSTHGTASCTPMVFDDFYFDDDTYLAVEIDNGSDVAWHIQFMQHTGLDSGHTYQIYFYADAEDEKTIAINWQENGDDWTVHWQQGDIVIANAEMYGPYEFVCDVTDHTADFKFIIGGDDIDIFLDSVSIVDLNATGVEDKPQEKIVRDFSLYPAYPNPFNMHTVIRYELPTTADVQLDIYNMQGKKVKTLATGSHAPGLHSLVWDGSNDSGDSVSSGVYVYRLQAEIDSKPVQASRKILLLK